MRLRSTNCTVVVSPPPQVKREPPERNLARGVKGESPVRAFRLRRRRCYKGGGGGGKGLFLPLRSLPPARAGWGKGGEAFSRSIFGAEGSCEEGGEGEAREAERKWKKVCSSSSSPLSLPEADTWRRNKVNAAPGKEMLQY